MKFPYEEMTEIARELVEEQNLSVACLKTVQTIDAVQEAREAIEAGADIIVCCGYQAILIKRYTKVPVAEVRLHTQEIGLLLKKAKARSIRASARRFTTTATAGRAPSSASTSVRWSRRSRWSCCSGRATAKRMRAGSRPAVARADHGTLFLVGIERMTMPVQHRLMRMFAFENIMRTDIQPMEELNVRVIAVSKTNLRCRVAEGDFSERLYYILQGLTLEIPSLNQRQEDLRYYFEKFFREFSKKYNKYLVATQGAYERIRTLSWEGNLLQLNAFCERLVLAADHRSIDEVYIQKTFDSLYPHIRESGGERQVVVYHSPEADRIHELLEKHRGNRAQVAQELGISTPTLWRRMKKYGVEAKYT